MLNSNDIDIIGLSETRLDKTVSDSEVCINGYNIFRNDRDVNGGGLEVLQFVSRQVCLNQPLE